MGKDIDDEHKAKEGTMTNDEIRKLAEEAGFVGVLVWWTFVIPKFRRLIELALAKERSHDNHA